VLLARHCLECHNASDHKGGLDLTRRERALAGGKHGKSLTPGDPDHSLILERVVSAEMPPSKRAKLSQQELGVLRQWIAGGARWAADPINPLLYTSSRRAGYDWWSLQPLRTVQPPAVKDTRWPINTIDRFILHRLEQDGLQPSPPADRRTLIRRLS
jgi:hypothetical protein